MQARCDILSNFFVLYAQCGLHGHRFNVAHQAEEFHGSAECRCDSTFLVQGHAPESEVPRSGSAQMTSHHGPGMATAPRGSLNRLKAMRLRRGPSGTLCSTTKDHKCCRLSVRISKRCLHAGLASLQSTAPAPQQAQPERVQQQSSHRTPGVRAMGASRPRVSTQPCDEELADLVSALNPTAVPAQQQHESPDPAHMTEKHSKAGLVSQGMPLMAPLDQVLSQQPAHPHAVCSQQPLRQNRVQDAPCLSNDAAANSVKQLKASLAPTVHLSQATAAPACSSSAAMPAMAQLHSMQGQGKVPNDAKTQSAAQRQTHCNSQADVPASCAADSQRRAGSPACEQKGVQGAPNGPPTVIRVAAPSIDRTNLSERVRQFRTNPPRPRFARGADGAGTEAQLAQAAQHVQSSVEHASGLLTEPPPRRSARVCYPEVPPAILGSAFNLRQAGPVTSSAHHTATSMPAIQQGPGSPSLMDPIRQQPAPRNRIAPIASHCEETVQAVPSSGGMLDWTARQQRIAFSSTDEANAPAADSANVCAIDSDAQGDVSVDRLLQRCRNLLRSSQSPAPDDGDAVPALQHKTGSSSHESQSSKCAVLVLLQHGDVVPSRNSDLRDTYNTHAVMFVRLQI